MSRVLAPLAAMLVAATATAGDISFTTLHPNYGETEKILAEKETEALARLADALSGYGTNRLRLSLAGSITVGDLVITNLTILGNLITINNIAYYFPTTVGGTNNILVNVGGGTNNSLAWYNFNTNQFLIGQDTNVSVKVAALTTNLISQDSLSVLGDGATAGSVVLKGINGTDGVTLKSPDALTSYVLTLPALQGAAGDVLTNNGAGLLSWGTAASGPGFGDLVWTNDSEVYKIVNHPTLLEWDSAANAFLLHGSLSPDLKLVSSSNTTVEAYVYGQNGVFQITGQGTNYVLLDPAMDTGGTTPFRFESLAPIDAASLHTIWANTGTNIALLWGDGALSLSGQTNLFTMAGGNAYFDGNRMAVAGDTLTGDVTATLDTDGSSAATIANDAVTYAKMQNVSAESKLLGRGQGGGAGDVEEITVGSGLSMSGTTLSATASGPSGSGTANVLAKWTGTSTLGDSLVKETAAVVVVQTNLAVTGQIQAAQGSRTVPAISFTNSQTVGWYSPEGLTGEWHFSGGSSEPAFKLTSGTFHIGSYLAFSYLTGHDLYAQAILNSPAGSTIQMGIQGDTTNQTFQAAFQSGSNKDAPNMRFAGGQSTGTGRGGAVELATSLSTAASTTQNNYASRLYISAKEVALTESSATLVLNVTLASTNIIGIRVMATTHADDGTDFQSVTETFAIAAVNKAGTVTTSVSASTPSATLTSAGTLTTTWTAVANGNSIDVKCNAVSSLTQNGIQCRWRAEIDCTQAPVITPQ